MYYHCHLIPSIAFQDVTPHSEASPNNKMIKTCLYVVEKLTMRKRRVGFTHCMPAVVRASVHLDEPRPVC